MRTAIVAVTVVFLLVAPASARAGGPPVRADLPMPTASPDQVRAKADEILARPEYQVPPKSLVDQFLDWLAERLRGLTGSGGGANTVIAWVGLAIIVGGLAFLVYRLTRSTRPESRQEIDILVDVARSSDEWREEAERLEARGEWKLALRARYRSLIGELIRREKVRDVPGRTTGEYRRDVDATVPGAADPFDSASELFEEAWYGDRPTGAPENARFRSLAGQVLEKVGRS